MRSPTTRTTDVDAAVCVVGAGPAGLTLARELAGHGVSVCLVEAGGEDVERRVQRQSRGESDGYPIHRLDHSRVRAVGGTLRHPRAREQGWMARPLDPVDFETRGWVPGSGWPFDRAHLDPFYARAEVHCGLSPHAEALAALRALRGQGSVDVEAHDLERAVFQHPTLRFVEDRADLLDAPEVRVLLHTRVVDLTTDGRGRRVQDVVAVGPDGGRVVVRADAVVLAAGGIENARLLLLARGGRGLGNEHDLVGRYFAERMIFTAGHLDLGPRGRQVVERLDAPDGVSAAVRVSEESQRALELLNCTIHLSSRSGFMATASAQSLWTLRRALERRPVLPHLGSHVASALGVVGDLPRLVRRAATGQGRAHLVGHMGEQAPNPASRVRLGRRKDDLGLPVARVTWRMTEADHRSAEASVRVVDDALRAQGLGRLQWTARLDRTTLVVGAHHHLGTTRMHDDPAQGVVDRDGRVHALDNLFVTGSSVFPTYGASNPTLTVVALAIRLADHLAGAGGAPRAVDAEPVGAEAVGGESVSEESAARAGRGPRGAAPPAAGRDTRRAGR